MRVIKVSRPPADLPEPSDRILFDYRLFTHCKHHLY